MFDRIRHVLIKLIAGKSPIMLNIEVDFTVPEINLRGEHGLVSGCFIRHSNESAMTFGPER